MEAKQVKDLMVPIAEYATVSENATLKEALAALDAAQKKYDDDKYAHRAIIVLDNNQQVVGKISQLDVIKALEPKYAELHGPNPGLSRFGFSKKFFEAIFEQHNLWSIPVNQLVRRAASLPVKSFMYRPEEGEYINDDTPIEEAIHMLVIGHHQSLLVLNGKKIVGILRLVDLFQTVSRIMAETE